MTLEAALIASKAIDLILIREKLLSRFSSVEVDKMILEYRNFLAYAAVADKPVGPTEKIDLVWHEHILHMQKYLWDCFNSFGKIIFHFPFSDSIKKEVAWLGEDDKCSGTTNCQDHPDCSNQDKGFSCSLTSEGDLFIKVKKPIINLDNPTAESLGSCEIFSSSLVEN